MDKAQEAKPVTLQGLIEDFLGYAQSQQQEANKLRRPAEIIQIQQRIIGVYEEALKTAGVDTEALLAEKMAPPPAAAPQNVVPMTPAE